MSKVRMLVGTRKGALIITARGKRAFEGPHFGGGEVYHVAGSPCEPETHLHLPDA